MIARVLTKTGATVQDRVIMHNMVAHSVLLDRSVSLVVMGAVIKVLEGFHHQEDRRITWMTATHGVGKEWEYPQVVASLEAAGIHPIME